MRTTSRIPRQLWICVGSRLAAIAPRYRCGSAGNRGRRRDTSGIRRPQASRDASRQRWLDYDLLTTDLLALGRSHLQFPMKTQPRWEWMRSYAERARNYFASHTAWREPTGDAL